MSGHRLAAGGSGIDRTTPVRFSFAGKSLTGYAGDTLASALLANGVEIVARSFKYHRPRGVVSAGPEEPNALVSLGVGARSEPNTRATMVPLHDGLVAGGQNAWPSLRHDLMAVNGLAGGLIGAGFYYKTFIGGPRGTWTRFFEPMIRRAAGMGEAPTEPDPDRYESAHHFCDVLVIGGGPAGLMAAKAAAEAGARVLIADERDGFGGALRHERAAIDGRPAPHFAAALAAELATRGVQILPRTTVYGQYDGAFGAVERVVDGSNDPGPLPRQRHWTIRPREVILAAGAIERPIVFASNDRPGVMLADAMRAYVNQYGVAPGRRVAIFTTHDGAYRTVRDLAAAGVTVAAIIDARPDVPHAAKAVAEAAGAELLAGATVAAVGGGKRVETIVTTDGRRIAADALGVSAGFMPTLHLTAQLGGKPEWDAALSAFRPGALPTHWHVAGAVDGTFGTGEALASGARAGAAALTALGLAVPDTTLPETDDDLLADRPAPLFHVPGKGKAFVDMQHDVTAKDIALARDEGFEAVEHLKRYTTLGMATDQGKTSNLNGLALMAAHLSRPIPDVGTTRYRPPYTPVAIGALAGETTGAHLRPVRRTPMHDWHIANGAEMVAAGAYLRPRAYLRPGESVTTAYVREATAVREAVGLVDVSTLGKIEVAGPDAAAFLDRIYVNAWGKLPVGKARYGVMLREDGFVFDDGTTWRLAEHRYLMTTTTQNAAKVLAHLDYLLATAWPELRVHVTSVSEAYATMAVAGPLARATLAAVVDGIDLAADAFPMMAIRTGRIGAADVRIARLSFSGENAYEVFCGAHHGLGVWETILAAGAPHGIQPYGTEALGALRIEKGHVAGGELDGRTTLHDLGLEKLAAAKPFVGSVLMNRPALCAPERLRLVGLRADGNAPIRTGAHLVGPSGRSEGHVTASTYSPVLGAQIALALLANGPARHGERLVAADPVRGGETPVIVTPYRHVDPEGSRLHG
ncbi:sarcosine oxidase subunit alpha family protein [Acuticoccus sp. M5D2P5]|uniref:sarcosine oxidase subunit alpha family protein n=1 Tax=Acuticoccus kalidii TaxID=2910977 RepID=UPI001F25D913|nr:sarcosine oxidase subunit alpha family protein [Acuticoccus kalidii]MCF3932212.1 sarcosine oxidase subunit alpha family protein [Acuticoccus kalidii]